jgi:glutamate/tyrosine decarboxylase-like PLP-dependent enzyme
MASDLSFSVDPAQATRMHAVGPETQAMAEALATLSVHRLCDPVPLDCASTPEALQAAVGETITPRGMGASAAIALWDEVLSRACISTDFHGYLAFIPSAPSKAAAAFDMLIGASSVYGGSWLEGAGAVYAENQALRWLADLAGLPEQAGGVFVQGGTSGNLSALVAARAAAQHRRASRPPRWAVLLSEETHSSAKHSLESVMDVDVVVVPGDERGRMTGAAVAAWAEAATPEQRDSVFAVVATAGTTNVGVVDDIDGIADVCEREGWWLHVDGAYGGAALAAPSVRHLFAGVERADSFIVDPHKWLFAPFDACALLYRDPVLARAAHTQKAGYLDPVNVDGEWNPSDFAVQLSRRARGLPFWFSLAVHGTEAYTAAIEHTLAVAREGRRLVDEAEHLRLLVEPDLSVLILERIGWSAEDYAAWSSRLMHEGTAFVTPSRHHGQPCTRFAVVNPMTTVADLELVIASMR